MCTLALTLIRYFEASPTADDGNRSGGSTSTSTSTSSLASSSTRRSNKSYSVWVGQGVLKCRRAQELLSTALTSPLPDWREKLDWLLARCEGYPQVLQAAAVAAGGSAAAAALRTDHERAVARLQATPEGFQIDSSDLTLAPEDPQAAAALLGGGRAAGAHGGSGDVRAASSTRSPNGGGTGDSSDSRGPNSDPSCASCVPAGEPHSSSTTSSSRIPDAQQGFSARLAALYERGLVVAFRGVSPDYWRDWDANGTALLLDLLYGPHCPHLHFTPELLDRACTRWCLPVLRAVLRHEGAGVFSPKHALLAACGGRWPPCPLRAGDGQALAVMEFFDQLGLLPAALAPGAPDTAAAAAAAVGQAAAAAAPGAADAQEQQQQQQPEEELLAANDPAGAEQQQQQMSLQERWSFAMTQAVMRGNGLPFLRYLHERCGAMPDLGSLAVWSRCSVEVLEWAAGVLRRAGGGKLPALITDGQVWGLLGYNQPALVWALRYLPAAGYSAPLLPSLEYVLTVIERQTVGSDRYIYVWPQLRQWLRLCARIAGHGCCAGEEEAKRQEGEKGGQAEGVAEGQQRGCCQQAEEEPQDVRWEDSSHGLFGAAAGLGAKRCAAEAGDGEEVLSASCGAATAATAAWIRSDAEWARLFAAMKEAQWDLPSSHRAWIERLRKQLGFPETPRQ
ncbi:hypothetical protein HYH02_002580 [Chlamydomonas schloesseri]|uniref:Uncharacterized protein n=1 Tax=Chlamydomonas schloesseri TaxID=2026947 RepID=A0A835WTN6_9CHLO|nr:hypothetical protein HYH02_002580 [Chlamydomonas schloesseri]|eukprot:KAG2453257.1 hypothetical protein HYH02_002580 [Chlamydomonas schloesseri]